MDALQNQASNTTFYRARTSATFIMTHTLQSSERIQVFGRSWNFGCQRKKMVFVTCWLAFIAVSNVIGHFTKNLCDKR